MRILVFNWRDITHPWAGGAELNIHEQAKHWVQTGHQVTLFCGAYEGSSRHANIDGIEIVRRGGRFDLQPSTRLASPMLASPLLLQLERNMMCQIHIRRKGHIIKH